LVKSHALHRAETSLHQNLNLLEHLLLK
jgi:hypothetical protein